MTLTDLDVVRMLKGHNPYPDGFVGESPNFKVKVDGKIVKYSYRGGELSPEVLAIAPHLSIKPTVMPPPPTIVELESNYVSITTPFNRFNVIVSEDIFKQRLEICRSCVEWVEDEHHTQGFCDKSKSGTKALWTIRERCPDNKWPVSSPVSPLSK